MHLSTRRNLHSHHFQSPLSHNLEVSAFGEEGEGDEGKAHLYTTGRKEGNVLFNDALNTFYLWLYGVRRMVEDYSDSEIGNPLLPHGLLFPINSKGSFI